MPDTRVDYLIVGGGTSGCVLASRLSADGQATVTVLEAGPDNPPDREHPAIRDPYPISLGHRNFSWTNLNAEVGADLRNGEPRFSRQYLQGFGLGGSSNIQGMVALRGIPRDYDEWREAGAAGWGWEDVLPYFRRLEKDLDFDGAFHGQDGPIPIRRVKPEHWAPFAKAFADSARKMGYPFIQDFNADFRAGVGSLPMANLPNQRVSVSMAYLDKAVRRRTNLSIVTGVHVDRVDFDGRRAVGVTARTSSGVERIAAREIIISAGALHTPSILMRSGVGPGEHLQQLGIKVISDLPGVGQRLMNHVGVGIAVYLPRRAVQDASQRGFGQSCLQFSSGIEGSDNDILVVAVNKGSWHPLGRRIGALAVEVHKTDSRGQVRLRGADPTMAPEVKFNLLSDDRDLARLEIGLKLCLQIATDEEVIKVADEFFLPNGKVVKALGERNAWNWARAGGIALLLGFGPMRKRLIGGSLLKPAALLQDAAALKRWALKHAVPPHHVSGTCRMGRIGDRGVVVDSECRVIGLEGLRVIDASIMPTLVRANTHITAIMIAEKMADRLRVARKRSV